MWSAGKKVAEARFCHAFASQTLIFCPTVLIFSLLLWPQPENSKTVRNFVLPLQGEKINVSALATFFKSPQRSNDSKNIEKKNPAESLPGVRLGTALPFWI